MEKNGLRESTIHRGENKPKSAPITQIVTICNRETIILTLDCAQSGID
jgi:hypothetical protein